MVDVTLYFGSCTVDYDGRASSYLAEGDRLVMIRPNVLTVHSLDDKINPVNYMQEANISIMDDTIIATRSNPSESIEVDFSRIDKRVMYSGSDEASLLMSGTEEELQKRLHLNASMVDDDFVSEEREYDTGAGRVDIKGLLDGEECLVEVKKTANMRAVGQLARYLKADDTDIGILASNNITGNAKELLYNYENIRWVGV